MGRDTLQGYVPGSYEEEMEQLRIALELSARPSAPKETRSTAKSSVTTSRGSTSRNVGETSGSRARVDEFNFRDNHGDLGASQFDPTRSTEARLCRRHGISRNEARRVLALLDGDVVRADDVSVFMASTKLGVDRAIAYLRNAGWDVESAMQRVYGGAEPSPDAEKERQELKQRADSMRRESRKTKEDSGTIKQNLNNHSDTHPPRTSAGFSQHSFRAASFMNERDRDAECYHKEQWDREMSSRVTQARRATFGSSEASENRNHSDRATKSRGSMPERVSGPTSPKKINAQTKTKTEFHRSTPSAAELADKGIVEILSEIGMKPSSTSVASVRSAYRKAALKYHPDRTRDQPERELKSDLWKLLSAKMDCYK